MKIVGLTGGIGCGKSTVAEMLAEKGARLIDADRMARVVVEPGKPAYNDIVAEFGEGVLAKDKTIDRPALAAVVFNDEKKRERLNALTHPRIGEEIAARLKRHSEEGARVTIIDAALLLESPATRWIKPVIVVVCDEEAKVGRIMERDDAKESEVRARIASQWSDGERRKHADYVIDNSGDLAALREQVDEVWSEISGGPE